MQIEVREIRPEDNSTICHIIKAVFEEHGINRPGTAYYDESLNHMSDCFKAPGSRYFIGLIDGVVYGGAGVFPTAGLPTDTCELVKMYLLPAARGKGLGRALIEACFDFARQSGYQRVYLETMPELKAAVRIYEKLGFSLLPAALGNSGHYSCSIHMLRNL
ncbi:MAG TPA: GNAT family N-acetyltransferase [Chitinophagales bacterium]|nr:GNAT family N-acetyltransferase [Chitinophagales bacterium]